MTADLSRYGAVTAKARAMFGRRLRRADYEKMGAMKSVSDVADYLRAHADWGRALEAVDTAALHRDRLEALLRRHSFAHFLRLFNYVGHEDRFILRYPVLSAEMEQIMRVMQLAASGRSGEYILSLPESFRRFSRIRYHLLTSVRTYDDLLEAAKYTDFYPALQKLRPADGAFPPYYQVETQMRRYYHRSFAGLLRGKTGSAWGLLREAVGMQADWENITAAERVLGYYPSLLPDIFQYLVPAGAHLRQAEIRAIVSLEDAGGLRELLKKTPYGPFLAGREEDSLERIGQICLMSFYRRQMASGVPSVFMSIAYINLYQNELRNLIRTIESVRYGLAPEEAGKFLVL